MALDASVPLSFQNNATEINYVTKLTRIVIRDPNDSRFDLEAYLNDVAAEAK